LDHNRNWTVLFVGGASGTGKSSIAYKIAKFYGVNIKSHCRQAYRRQFACDY